MIKSRFVLTAILAAFIVGCIAVIAVAQDENPADTAVVVEKPAPPGIVTVVDNPNDNGHFLFVTWEPSPDEGQAGDKEVIAYDIYRSSQADGEYLKMGTVGSDSHEYKDGDDVATISGEPNPKFMAKNTPYYIKVQALSITGVGSDFSEPTGGTPEGNWYHTGKTSYLMAILIYLGLVLYYIKVAKSGKKLYIRPLGGIEAIDNAIGRATEMGRPILFVLGTGSAADIATIAGYTILGRVARKTAEYQIPVLVPVNDPIIMSVAQETVRSAYIEAGRPELYDEKNIPYVAAMQFPYVAAVNGIMIREKTATNFYMGLFHAEALLLAETGSTTGAIQIAGTDQPAQLPFFIAATDFTLIGEELYAASAYLSRKPALLGALKAQDYAKALLIVFILLGTLTVSFGWTFIIDLFHVTI